MTAAKIENAAPADQPPDPPRHLPRFVQLFARQAPGLAHGASDPDRRAHSPAKRPRSCAVSRPCEARENVDAAWAMGRRDPATSGTARASLPRRWRALSRNGDSRRIAMPIECAASMLVWMSATAVRRGQSEARVSSFWLELLSTGHGALHPRPDAVALIVQLARSPQTGPARRGRGWTPEPRLARTADGAVTLSPGLLPRRAGRRWPRCWATCSSRRPGDRRHGTRTGPARQSSIALLDSSPTARCPPDGVRRGARRRSSRPIRRAPFQPPWSRPRRRTQRRRRPCRR